MPVTASDILKNVSEGNLNTSDGMLSENAESPFIRMIILDVISDPKIILSDKDTKSKLVSFNIKNIELISTLPRNTIVAKKIGYEEDPVFAFPFFPSHISMPCKPGECVWVITVGEKFFWFCKITESSLSDDINHSHLSHAFEPTLWDGTKNIVENQSSEAKNNTKEGDSIWYELRNGIVNTDDNERTTSKENIILRGEKEDIFEKLLTETDSSKLISYESVPRFSKRPGDVAFEGTNNTLIVLGSDRKDELKKTSFDGSSGMIDIVAGRGQTKETYGASADTTQIVAGKKKGEKIKSELNKSPSVLEPNEGNPDFRNDRSRILVSQRTSVDKNFELESYNKEKFDISDSPDPNGGDAAIVIKTDKIRLIARADVEIIVKGFNSEKSPDGQKRKDEKSESDEWASIVIKANGDIVMKPSKTGYIKLGGDEADLAVLCEKASKAEGIVTCPGGITDTMGGIQGLGPTGGTGQGTFATKVLLK